MVVLVQRRSVVYREPRFGRLVTGPLMLRRRRFPGWPKSCGGRITPVTVAATNAIGVITGMSPAISVTPAPTMGNGPEATRLMEAAVVTATLLFANRDFPTVTLRWELT